MSRLFGMTSGRKRFAVCLAAFLALSLHAFANVSTAKAAVPNDFDKTPVVESGLDQPTAFRFVPDGRIFIAEKAGAIRVVEDGVLKPQPMFVLSTANSDERGLLGIELDPSFSVNGFIYVAYTAADNMDRLSRFHVIGGIVDPASEFVLLQSDQQANVFHHGGEVRFGPDGKIYWALGMNLYNPNSPNLSTIQGKILRINPDGSIPSDNPFYNTEGANKAIWAYGLRNPFRFDVIPSGANAGKPITGDVGGSHWEEIDVITRGGNYGWPYAEGNCNGCGYINPVFAYPHTDPPSLAGSITGVAVYTGNAFPTEYANAVFYADYTLHFVKYLVMDSDFDSVISDNVFDADAGTPVQLSVGPDGDLYQLDIYPGALYKIGPSGGNRAPVARAAAVPGSGLAPLDVAFSSAGSVDPDGTPITYLWDFKDGATSTDPSPTHTYDVNGIYDVTLTVSDGSKSSTATVQVTVGNTAPSGVITSPVDGAHYDAGDTIAYSATGTDAEDGDLPASGFSWTIVFHHADHIHPFLGPLPGAKSGSFVIPRNSDNVATTWYEIKLTVTDSGGLSHTSSVAVHPNLVSVTYSSSPTGVAYSVDGIPFSDTHTEQAVVGVDLVLSTTSPQFVDGAQYAFDSWSDGGNMTHTARVPSTDVSYEATFSGLSEPPTPWTSLDIGARTAAGTSSYVNGTFSISGGGNDIWAEADEFRYVYQPLIGDGTIVARVSSQADTSPWAKSGVMIKSSATAGATYALIAVTPSNGMHFQYGFSGDAGETPYSLPDGWMKLERVGDVFNAYSSPDGVSWTQIGSTTIAMPEATTIGLFVSSHNDTVLNTSTFDDVTVSGGGVGGALPAPWSHTDIGGAQPAGGATFDGQTSTYVVAGGGNDVWGDVDQLSYVYRPLTGDGTIVARVKSQDDTDPWAKSGVMIKETTTAGAKYAAMFVTPGNGYHFQHGYDSDVGGGSYTFPSAWVKLTRSGSVITAFTSTDGQTWQQVGAATIQMAADVTVGLFVSAHNGSIGLNSSSFDNVAVASATGAPLPSGWQSADVGAPTLEGSASYQNGTFALHGSGSDVWGTDDQFQFVSSPLVGDGEIVARVTSQDNTDSWAKSGVMIKESAAQGAPYAALMVTPGHGIHLQSGFNADVAGGSQALPVWLKLQRVGSTITAYRSSDGVDWTPVGSVVIAMGADVRIGLFVSAHNVAVLNTTTFDNVEVASAAGALPEGWTQTDVGAPALPGSATFESGTFTLSGGGNDVWAGDDQFHLVDRELVGDGTIVARVVSQTVSDEWAKAGVMIKRGTSAGSDYVALMTTPGHGVRMQTGFAIDQGGAADTLPVWLKLVRSGDSITAFESSDGATWSQVGAPVSMAGAGSVVIGLFVCSHNGGTIGTASFDQVTVTP